MARQVAVAVDLGASGGRVVSGAFDGRILELEEMHRFENGPVPMAGHLVWDLPRLWHEVLAGLRAAAARHGEAVSTVGVDTWGVDFSFLGADGSLLANPVCYRDARTRGVLAAAERIVPRDRIFEATGLQFMEINSLYQFLALKHATSSVLAAADRMLMIPDLFHWLLTGQASNERTNASTTQCYDPRRGDWAFDMLERFGLPRRIFGPLTDPGTNLGALRKEIAADTGLRAARVVVPGTHDTASAVAAVPADEPPSSRPDWCYVSLGKCRAAWQRTGTGWSWDQLTALAAEAPPLVTLIDPNDPSLVAPADMPEAIRALAKRSGEAVPDSTAAIVRAALESVAAAIRRTLVELDELLGRRVSRVHVVGGGVQNRLLCQMIADATDRPVVAGPVEATAIGNLLVQLAGREGPLDLRTIRGIVRDSFEPQRYEPRDAARWQARLG